MCAHPVQERHDEVDPRPQHRPQPAEAFDHMLFALRHDPDAKEDADDEEERDEKERRASTAAVRRGVHSSCRAPAMNPDGAIRGLSKAGRGNRAGSRPPVRGTRWRQTPRAPPRGVNSRRAGPPLPRPRTLEPPAPRLFRASFRARRRPRPFSAPSPRTAPSACRAFFPEGRLALHPFLSALNPVDVVVAKCLPACCRHELLPG